MSDRILHTSPSDPLAQPLLDELRFEYDSRYHDLFKQLGESAQRELDRYPPELFSPPHGGSFLLLLRDGRAIAGGAFKRHEDPGTAEFKRIWTDSRLRRQGLARRVLVALEAEALRQGYRRIFLTTGFRQPEAEGLYLSHGYQRLFDPAADREALRSLPFDKQLDAGWFHTAAAHQAHAQAQVSLS